MSPRWRRDLTEMKEISSSLMRSPRELGEICYVSEINSPRSRQELNEVCSGPYLISCFKLPYIYPGGYSHTLPIRVCAAQRGRDFEAPDLERGIHFRGVF